MDYYKRYMGDYGRDTGHLSMEQHGAYILLLDHYYSRGKPLMASVPALCRLCRATTKSEQAAVQSVVDEFFPVASDGLRHNKRADEELTKWDELSSQASEAGKRGAQKRWGKNGGGHGGGHSSGHGGSDGGGYSEGDSEPHSDRSSGDGNEKIALQLQIPETRNQKPEPTPLRTRASGREEVKKTTDLEPDFDPNDAWREAHPNCDSQAYESWLAYRAEAHDPVPPRVRIEHAKFLAAKGTAEEQRAFVSRLIQLQFKRLHEPGGNGGSTTAAGEPRKRWHPDDGDPTEPKAAPT